MIKLMESRVLSQKIFVATVVGVILAVSFLIGMENNGRFVRPMGDYLPSLAAQLPQDHNDFQNNLSNYPHALRNFLKENILSYLPEYKTPCWYQDDGRLLCLPYFYQVGFAKCGTTDLCNRVRAHPEIVEYTRKENHWISRNMFSSRNGKPYMKPLTAYAGLYQRAVPEIRRSTDSSGYHYKILGDCTVSTSFENFYWKLMRSEADKPNYEPVFTNADLLHYFNPNAKIIMIIRDPVERLYSGFMFFKHHTRTPNVFDAYVKKNIADFKSCLETNRTLRGCVYGPYPFDKETVRVRLGMYHVHIKEFQRVFSQDQILLLKLEEFSKNIPLYLKKVYAFLDLEPLSDKTIESFVNKSRKNVRGKAQKSEGDMFNSTRALLTEFYRPFNEELGKLLGDEFNYNIKN